MITGLLYDAKNGGRYFRNFYARRILRIMPLYYAFLLATLVVLPAALPVLPSRLVRLLKLPELVHGDAASLLFYYANFRLAFTHRSFNVFTPFWSLAVEEHFYLLWPVAVFVLSRRNLMRLCLAGAVLSLGWRLAAVCIGADDGIARMATPGALDGLLLGGWLALARRNQAEWARVRPRTLPLLLGTGGFVLCLMASHMHFASGVDLRDTDQNLAGGLLTNTLGISALALFFAALLARVLDAPEGALLRRTLEHPSLKSIGKYSYAIYVFHSLILLYTYRLVAGRLAHYVSLSPAKLIITVWLLGISFVAAWISYHYFEIHFLRLKRFFEPGRQSFPRVLGAPRGMKV